MPLTLGDKFTPSWMGRPPHMSPEDLRIWDRAKIELLRSARAVYYDVGLGGQTDVPPNTTPEQALMWQRVTQKRADVVIETDALWNIVELRENASASALGRLLLYRDMWLKERPDNKPVILTLVSNIEDADVRETARTIGIVYMIF